MNVNVYDYGEWRLFTEAEESILKSLREQMVDFIYYSS